MSEASVNDWDGRPQNPDTDGWHWLQCDDDEPEAYHWVGGKWQDGRHGVPIVSNPCWRYLGPCATSAYLNLLRSEIDNLIADNERLMDALTKEAAAHTATINRSEYEVRVARQWDEYHPAYTAGAKAGAYNERQACIQICFEKQKLYADERYAINQPMSSFGERFACGQIIEAIMERGGEKPSWRKDEE